ncbi:trace amine-associated receptor 365-like [Petromyzon marinus]|uniref:trace amine-associated receptor 365-like n=1 Tax=Petromyzon marinus TaxID=7757 RepID=UPI003F6E904B
MTMAVQCSLSHDGRFNCSAPSLGPEESRALAFLCFSLATLTVMGNLLVVASIALFRQLQTRTNAFTLSLAVADLLVGLLVMPFSATRSLYGCWFFGRTFCKVHTCLDVLLSTASIAHLGAIAFDRHTAICDPLRYHQRLTAGRAASLLALCWVGSALLAVGPILLGWNTVGIEELVASLSCPDACAFFMNAPFAIAGSTCSFFGPSFIMVVTYMRIYRVALRQARAVRNVISVSSVARQRCDIDSPPEQGRDQRRERGATKTLGVIMGTFVICWLPFFSLTLLDPFTGFLAEPWVWEAATWLGYVNSALNPILYPAFNRAFRRAFCLVFTCAWRSQNMRRADLAE